MQFQYFLAHELKKSIVEIEQMDIVEYQRWGLFFQRKTEAEKKVMDRARRRR